MATKWVCLLCISGILLASAPTAASIGDISGVIQSFMAMQFPDARSHVWVVNGIQWQAENEVLVDLNTIVIGRASHTPTENRFLLLIVEGRLAGAQNIPVDAKVDCQPEQA